jgi:hypothetical protein
VLFDVMLARFRGVMVGVDGVAASRMRVMSSGFMVATVMVLCGQMVVPGSVLMMLGRLLVVLARWVRCHIVPPWMPPLFEYLRVGRRVYSAEVTRPEQHGDSFGTRLRRFESRVFLEISG